MTVYCALPETARLEIAAGNGEISFGGSQEWYGDKWRRASGCGPVAASNIMWYLAATRHGAGGLIPSAGRSRDDFIGLMEKMFSYVTPGIGGVNSASAFTAGAVRYAGSLGFALEADALEIPAGLARRPKPEDVADFVARALSGGLPVAFLNLSNGALDNLESWHWVTITALDSGSMTASVSDQGRKKDAAIGDWLRTSALGGALAVLSPAKRGVG